VSTLKMEAAYLSQKLVFIQKTTRYYKLKDNNLNPIVIEGMFMSSLTKRLHVYFEFRSFLSCWILQSAPDTDRDLFSFGSSVGFSWYGHRVRNSHGTWPCVQDQFRSDSVRPRSWLGGFADFLHSNLPEWDRE
jgi:hypothetical protein